MRTRSTGQTMNSLRGTYLLLKTFKTDVMTAVNESFRWILRREDIFALGAVELGTHKIITVNF